MRLIRHPDRSRAQRGEAEGPFCCSVDKTRSLDCAALRAPSLGMTGKVGDYGPVTALTLRGLLSISAWDGGP